ncbi:PAS domain-containing protein [Sorangium sp. So ce429]
MQSMIGSRAEADGVQGELESARRRIAELEREIADVAAKEARLRGLVSASPIVIYTCKPSGDYGVTYMSDNVCRFFGYTAEDFTSNSSFWAERIHPDDMDRVFRSLEKLSEHDYTKHEYRFKHKDGRWRWVHDDVALSRDASGNVIEYVGFWQDVDERRTAEELIQRQSESLREMSTPLVPISEHVVAMPLIGLMDSHRAQQVLSTLLDGIGRTGARVAIIDITGVALVDTYVASALIRSAKAAQLMGARVVITGIRPEVAQMLVSLQIDLAGIVTSGTMQAGIAVAQSLARVGAAESARPA